MTEGQPPAPPPPSGEGPPTPTPAPEDAQPERAPAAYPLLAEVDGRDEYARFMPLVKWLLLLPHYIALAFVGIGALVAIVIAWFAVIFTRRYPRGLFGFVVGFQRWAWRVQAYFLLMTDDYPPFTLGEAPDYPARYDVTYPEEIDRWRPLVQWLLIIPYAIVARVLGYLGGILVFFAFFTILFTKRFPEGMFKIVLVTLRWNARTFVYGAFLVTRYPPWAWE